ncbi:hypothetical protein [Paracoccus sp. JM45]|uniref:hypothetical protein n=1 Tax=Paracoccus sp. JM45 TaxID=2283626 RepID=UPI0011C3D1C2|nr:hypothetical protein [Paracoccus sp. JM45]
MDKAREAVQKPSKSLLKVLQSMEVSWDDADELRDYLLLKGGKPAGCFPDITVSFARDLWFAYL